MRYSRQEIFIGKKAQKILEKSTVSIIGLGALGTVTANLLARSGINLILIDRDLLELSNLQRQSLFNEKDINKPKVIAAGEKLKKINSQIKIKAYFEDLNYKNINIIKSDLILDCTDNLETRLLLNEFSIKNNIPLIYASAIRDKGYIFNIIKKPCLKCLLKNSATTETCETSGVLNTITNIIASIQVNETIKLLTNNNPEKDLIYLDLNTNSITKIKVSPNKKCPVCNKKFEYLNSKKTIEKYCDSYIFRNKFNYNIVKKQLKSHGAIIVKNTIIFNKLTVFPNSVLIKTNSEEEAKSLYSKYIGD